MNIRNYLLLLATCASFNTFAQNSNFNTAVYFESGQSNISSKDSAALEQFLTRLTATNDYEISILAYTDDRGTDKDNQLLAANRSEAVLSFLKVKNMPTPTRQTVQPVGEIALSSQKNIEELRRRNRRVDINISVFAPQTMNELFSYFNQRNKTIFECSAKDTVLLGQKGSILSIPANAFVLADSKGAKIKYPIEIELREAYSFGDMLTNNVSTISDGKLIQTGGMLYVGAKDANGKELKLDAGKQIEVGMPAKGELKKDMQLFTANREANDNISNTNWKPQAETFVQVSMGNANGEVFRDYDGKKVNTSVTKNKLDKWNNELFKPLIINAQFPDSIWLQQPKEPLKPKLVEIKAVQPTVELVKKQFKIQKKEKAADYEARILVQIENQTKNYERKLNERKIRQQEYETAIQKYEAELSIYQQNIKLFYASRQSVKDYFDVLMQGDTNSAYQQFYKQHKQWETTTTQLTMRLNVKNQQLRQLDYFMMVCYRAGLVTFIPKLKVIKQDYQNKQENATVWHQAHLKEAKTLSFLGKNLGFNKGIQMEFSNRNGSEEQSTYVKLHYAGNNWKKCFDFSTIEKENNFLYFAIKFHKNTLSKCTADNYQKLATLSENVDRLIAMDVSSAQQSEIELISKQINDSLQQQKLVIAKYNLELISGKVNQLAGEVNVANFSKWISCVYEIDEIKRIDLQNTAFMNNVAAVEKEIKTQISSNIHKLIKLTLVKIQNDLASIKDTNSNALSSLSNNMNNLQYLVGHSTYDANYSNISQDVKKARNHYYAILNARNITEAKSNITKMDNITSNNLTNIALNLTTISGLGWVNCDRFYESEKLTHTNILVQVNSEDKCFMVFPELDLIIPMELQPNGSGFRTPSSYNGVPIDAKVKIIGLRAENGQVQTFILEDLVQNIANQHISFKNSKVTDLIALFEQI